MLLLADRFSKPGGTMASSAGSIVSTDISVLTTATGASGRSLFPTTANATSGGRPVDLIDDGRPNIRIPARQRIPRASGPRRECRTDRSLAALRRGGRARVQTGPGRL